jgi:hypothetical protein
MNGRFTVLICLCVTAVLGAVHAADTAGMPLGSAASRSRRWKSVVLWSNGTLSATLNYLPEASLADEDYMFVEFNNRTGRSLDVQQAWLGLPGTRVNLATKASVFMSDMTGGGIYNGKLPPGKTKAGQHGVFECGLANLGLPPQEGFQVDLVAKADVRLSDGRAFSTSAEGVKFGFLWRYPSRKEMASMSRRFKELLAHPQYNFGHGYRLHSLTAVQEVADSATLEELLAARQSRQNSVDGRDSVVRVLARRFAGAPEVVQLYKTELEQGNSAAVDDMLPGQLWNSAWVGSVVSIFEKTGNSSLLLILGYHRSDWATNEVAVERLAAGLLRHRPVLNTNVTYLAAGDLYSWCGAAYEAGEIGAHSLVPVLRPGLDDRRLAIHPHEDRLANTPQRRRVCDVALQGILKIVDGSPEAAMVRASTELKAKGLPADSQAVTDLAIEALKQRLQAGPLKKEQP